MSMYGIPNRASDAGPDSQELPRDATDWIFEAEDMLRDARRIARDDIAVQCKLQREALVAAREAIDPALKLLEAK